MVQLVTMANLRSHLDRLARTPVLLVAADFDGTLAPIVERPDLAQADASSVAALKALAATPRTHVAIISGRSLADLARHIPDAGGIHLIGSHGAEAAMHLPLTSTPAALASLAKSHRYMRRLASQTPGSLVEKKPAGCAFHYRNADEAAAALALVKLAEKAKQWPKLYIRHGKKVFEVSTVQADKGHALASLRRHVRATAVLYVGDDITDEDVFQKLSRHDVSAKVGEGPTSAGYRLADTRAVSRMLKGILRRRKAHLTVRA